MKINKALLILWSTLLLSACMRQGSPAASPTVQASSVSQTPVPIGSTSPGVRLNPTFSLDLTSLSELPVGITKIADQKGRADEALAFNGEATKVQLPWDINVEKYPKLTITAWARFTGEPEEKPQFQVVSHDDGGFDRSLGIDARSGEWGWSAFAGDANVIGGIPIRPKEWVFLAVSYDESAGESRLTVDDAVVLAKEESHLGSGHPFVWIGGNPGFGEHFVGDIAHVQVYDRVLTDEELKSVREQ